MLLRVLLNSLRNYVTAQKGRKAHKGGKGFKGYKLVALTGNTCLTAKGKYRFSLLGSFAFFAFYNLNSEKNAALLPQGYSFALTAKGKHRVFLFGLFRLFCLARTPLLQVFNIF